MCGDVIPPEERVVPYLLESEWFQDFASFGTKLVFRGVRCKSPSLLDRVCP